MQRNALLFVLPLLVTAVLPVAQNPAATQQTAQNEAVTASIDKIRQAKARNFWSRASVLKEKGSSNRKLVQMALDDSSPKVQIAAAYALYKITDDTDTSDDESTSKKKDALGTLISIAKNNNASVRKLAGDAIWHLSRNDEFLVEVPDADTTLRALLAESSSPSVKLSLARALVGVKGFSLKAREALIELLEGNSDGIRFNAAVALARMDASQEARPVLESFTDEPTDRGMLAQTLLQKLNLSRNLQLQKSSSSTKYPVLDEIFNKINEHYVDADKVDRKKLVEGAAKGITKQLDPFSTYLNKEKLESLKEGLDRSYGGIGAVVSMRDGYLTIERPIYSGPAYEAGLRTNDQIIKVEGKSTYEEELQSIVKKLKGEPGTEVTFSVMRRGWTEPKEFTIERGQIDTKTAKHRMLPGQIGYIQIISFGENTDTEVRKAIQQLKSEGMKGLIVDVRNNSGGYLPTAIHITDYFLKPEDENGNKNLILSVRGKGRDRSFFAERPQVYSGPLSVLVNNGSASASEIFSGTLQDHSRASVIGQRTVGKGSVQQLLPLDSTDGAAIKLTQAKYYLPSGRTPHRSNWDQDEVSMDDNSEGGIKPTVTIKPEEDSYWFAYASEQLLETGRIDDYISSKRDSHLETFKKLARYDGNSWKKYPGFDKFFSSLDTKLNRDRVRRLLRNELRRKIGDIRGQAFIVDYQSDIQVRRAILDLLNKRGASPDQYTPYAGLQKEIDTHLEEQENRIETK